MMRWLLATGLLLAVPFGLAQAEYLIIVANLGLSKDGETAKPGAPGFPGGNLPGFPGAGGNRGGLPGIPGGANRGAAGAIGGPPPGFPGGMGNRGGPPGFPGGAGNRGGAGFPGAGGTMPGMGGFPGGKGGGSGEDLTGTPLNVVAIIEVAVSSQQRFTQGKWVEVRHNLMAPQAAHCFLKDLTDFSVAKVINVKTINQQFRERLSKMEKQESLQKPEDWLKLAKWSLEHGSVTHFSEVMDRIEKKDKSNATVQTYLKAKEALEKPVTKENDAKPWMSRLNDRFKMVQSAHYILIHKADNDKSPEVTALLDHLENNMKSFYYWFALQGKTLPVPDQRFVVALINSEFDRKMEIFGSPSLVGDGFYVLRNNIAIFSQKPVDPDFRALDERTNDIFRKYPRGKLLKGTTVKTENGAGTDMDATATYQTYALLHKALEEDWERATVSHEGTRQLIVGAGLLSQGVMAPQWIDFGMASFFATPKGAPWAETGSENTAYLPGFRDWGLKILGSNSSKIAAEALKNTVTDSFFREAAKGKTPAEKQALLKKARTMAWGLSYFLAKNRLDDLLQYYQELAKLPRDLEFDDQVLMEIFARSFKLMDESGKKVDPMKLEQLAENWRSTVSATPLEHEELIKEAAKMIGAQNQGPPGTAGAGNKGPGVGGKLGGGGAGGE
ncbi:MAG: DUF1570 domain-containing protein [Gemmataceae bacterium]